MPFRAGFVAMEAAGPALEGRLGLEDDLLGGQWAKPERRHRAAKKGHRRHVCPARKMQRRAVVRHYNGRAGNQGVRGHQRQGRCLEDQVVGRIGGAFRKQ